MKNHANSVERRFHPRRRLKDTQKCTTKTSPMFQTLLFLVLCVRKRLQNLGILKDGNRTLIVKETVIEKSVQCNQCNYKAMTRWLLNGHKQLKYLGIVRPESRGRNGKPGTMTNHFSLLCVHTFTFLMCRAS